MAIHCWHVAAPWSVSDCAEEGPHENAQMIIAPAKSDRVMVPLPFCIAPSPFKSAGWQRNTQPDFWFQEATRFPVPKK